MIEETAKFTSIDPEQLFENERTDTERRTYTHENADHCEADADGRAIVGVTSEDGRVLLLVNSEEDHTILPNDTVAPGEDWATVGQSWVEKSAGIDITLDDVERVRRVEHVVDGESTPHSVAHHVVFGASVASAGTIPDGLCADDPWELGWYDELPLDTDDDDAGVLADIRLFLD